MMKQLLAFIICLPLTILYVSGQDTLTPECKPGRFYGITSIGSIYAFTLAGNNITVDGQVTPPSPGRVTGSLAIATMNSSRRFYSSDRFGVLFEYNNKWDTIYDNSAREISNLGGYNNYLYGHSGTANSLYIDRFTAGAFTNIITDPSFSIADVVVDSLGRVYFFTRINADSVKLQIATPTGTIVASYPLALKGFAGYGCFLMGNILYAGFGEQHPSHPNSLVPISINATSATVGAPIPMPAMPSLNFYDLASCGNYNTVSSCSTPLVLTLSASPDPVMAGTPVNLVVTGNRTFTVTSWQPANLFPNQTITTQNVILTAPTIITVRGINADGCADTATIALTVEGAEGVWVPNAFSPDNNGRNDMLYVYGNSISKLDFTIWNKWGEKIFATQNKNTGWGGIYKGKVQPMGVYIYVVKVVLTNGKEIMKTGAITLLR